MTATVATTAAAATTATVALFDFDGTLIRRDSTSTLVKQLLRLRPWRALVIAPLVIRLRRARTPEALQAAKCAIIGALVKDLSESRVAAAVERACETVHRERRPQVIEALRVCAKQGHRVLVVSASAGFFLRRALQDLPVELIATEFAIDRNRFTGAVSGEVCFGQAKVALIRCRVASGAVITEAWTDSLHDLPMMRMAQRRCWLCPPASADAVRREDPGAEIVSTVGSESRV